MELRNGNRAESETVQVNPIEVDAERLLEIYIDPKLKRVLQEWQKLF